jgi:hypothetical protein
LKTPSAIVGGPYMDFRPTGFSIVNRQSTIVNVTVREALTIDEGRLTIENPNIRDWRLMIGD